MPDIRFVVFAHARSGSTSLTRALNCHPDVKIAEEAFHPRYHEWHPDEPSYVNSIVDRHSLDLALRTIGSRYDGIKILSYQLSEELYSYLLTIPALRVVYLYRRNALQAVVSGMIAEQTGAWQASDLTGDILRRYGRLKAVPIDLIAERLDYVQHCHSVYLRVLSERECSAWKAVVYEELYTRDLAANVERLREIQTFLAVKPCVTAAMVRYLDPQLSRLNSRARYAAIPNVREIDAALGSDETGRLLE